MHLSIDIDVWPVFHLGRNLRIPETCTSHERASFGFKKWLESEPDIKDLNRRQTQITLHDLCDHIDMFFAALEGEDRDHAYRYESENTDVRVVIENTCPESMERQRILTDEMLDAFSKGQELSPILKERMEQYWINEDGRVVDTRPF